MHLDPEAQSELRLHLQLHRRDPSNGAVLGSEHFRKYSGATLQGRDHSGHSGPLLPFIGVLHSSCGLEVL